MLRTSVQLGVGRDDDRWSPGFTKASTVTAFYGGICVTQLTTDSTGMTLIPSGVVGSQGIISAASPFPLGLVFEATFPPSNTFANGDNAAGNYDSSAYAKGGVYTVFHRPGNAIDVLDDQRNTAQVTINKNGGGTVAQNTSAPFVVSDAWAVGLPVYFTEIGLLTITVPGSGTYVRVGFVRAVSGTGADLLVTIELNMQQSGNP
jgi:hypothetical protein